MNRLLRGVIVVTLAAISVRLQAQTCPTIAIQFPSNNATGISVDPPPTLKWTAYPGATGYDIYFGKSSSAPCSGSPVATSTTASWTPPTALLPATAFSWKVKALGAFACAIQSPCVNFATTSCPASAPNLVQPVGGTVPFGDVSFKWNGVAFTSVYTLSVSIGGSPFQTTTYSSSTLSKSMLIGMGQHVTWYVTAIGDGCPAQQSQRASFDTSCPTTAPSLLAPLQGASIPENQRIDFQWSSVALAKSYSLFVTPDSGKTFQTLATNITATQFSATLPKGDWGWSVSANYENACGPVMSQGNGFTVGGSGCPPNPGKAILVSPANGAKNISAPVTFSWNAVPSATGYRVLYIPTNASTIDLGFTTQTSLTADVPSGDGTWFVQTSFGPDCPPTLSDRFTLNVTAGTCTGAAPQLLSPANNATNVETKVNFQWSAVQNAIGYALFASVDGSDFVPYGTTTDTAIEKFVPTGTIRWYVVALFARCSPGRSTTFTFTAGEADPCPRGTISVTAPAAGSTQTSPVHATWTAVANAVRYRVWAALENSPAVLVTQTTLTSADLSLPAGEISLYVDAVFDGDCPPVRSAEVRFTVSTASDCSANKPPVLVSPLGAKVTNPVTLRWNASANAIGYRVWVASESDNAFEDLGLTRETELSRTLGAGTYFWFVQALFENCRAQSSEKARFEVEAARCANGSPSVISPAKDATVQSPVTIVWTAVPNAVKYRVLVRVDSDQAIFTTSATTLTKTLPPGNASIVVEAVFENCPSTFSPRIDFKVEAAQNCSNEKARIVQPAAGANVTSPFDISWNPVNGAIRYILFGRLGEGNPTAIAETTETHLTQKAPAGPLELWIVTVFRGCRPTESEHLRINVTVPAECASHRAPVLLLPANDTRVTHSRTFFAWTKVPLAARYRVWAWQNDDQPSIIATTQVNEAVAKLEPGAWKWFVEADFTGCPPTESAQAEFSVAAEGACTTPEQPTAHAIGQALSNSTFTIRWTPLSHVSRFELQESQTADFADPQTFLVDGTSRQFKHEATHTVQWFYRVRGISDCSEERGLYSDTVGVVIVPQRTNLSSAELGTDDTFVQKVFLPGQSAPVQFTARTDRPWARVTPPNGTLPTTGLELAITIDQSMIGAGTNTFTLKVDYSSSSAKALHENATTVSIPVSVSLVTPVTPTGKGTPSPDSLIFLGVGHAAGQNDSLFESDARITNLGAQTMKYSLYYTPTGTDGTTTGTATTIEIPPNQTLALDDIVSSAFGIGSITGTVGMLEVRPLTSSTSAGSLFSTISSTAQQLLTLGSSRTYNSTPTGTFGQYIPAVPFSKFVGSGKVLSLMQVAQSAAYRANFGFLEASGQPVDLAVRVFDVSGNLLKTIPVSLQAGEHKQIGLMLAANGIDNLDDGRVEVEVTGGSGKVTAYVSELDNATNDPFLVSAVEKGSVNTNRYVVPGMAHKDLGFAFWVSDLRVYNAGAASVTATLTFYAEANPSDSVSKQVTIAAGQIAVLNDVVQNLFERANGSGGSIVITTPQNAPLGVTARTYNKTSNGTYGQYIPGVTVAESVGNGDRAIQVLQVENSSRFRTYVAMTETTGNPARVEVSLIQPDSIVTPVVAYDLAANEYRQISLADFGQPEAIYNARVTVKVISGTGKVTASGSSIDMSTNDPTYIMGQ